MYTLFSSEPSREGYRLERMEIFNWGTFDREIYRISPAGNNSLLTGANGSGKTTYVDALLTLLVPIRKYRFYNRSSGTDKKDERTEASYVRGAYGEIQEEGKNNSRTLYIRPDKKNVYSILLASFSNAQHRPVTLFQVRWFFNGQLKRVYGICREQLNIEEHFRPLDPGGEWKKALKKLFPRLGGKDMIEFFDSAAGYADKLVKYFGMRSEKALGLFNQIVGIKVLGNLDQFIRANMLEPREAEEEFQGLKENYETLLEAYRQIEKASEQARQLAPIRDLAGQVDEIENRLNELQLLQEILNVYFSSRLLDFLGAEIEKQQRSLTASEQKMQTVDRQLEDNEDRRSDLKLSIERDETGQRIKEILRRLSQMEKEKNSRQTRQEKYARLADGLELHGTPNEPLFNENRETAIALQSKTVADAGLIEEQQYQARKAVDHGTGEFDALAAQIRQLKGQKNKITGRVSEIRGEIVQHVRAAPDEIPFIGELIKVKDTEKEWEAAIERLLHNFALRLLVPDKYYDSVNRYVNKNNLRGRIVYHRVRDEKFMNDLLPRPEGLVLEKLDLKKTIYRDWLEDQLLKHYDYICTDHVSQFHKYKRALTIQGLIKNKDHHQKDDRPEVVSSERFVLGWDNKEKIMALARKANELKKEIDEKKEQLKKYERQSAKLRKKRENLIKFLEFDCFADIDWQSAAKEIEELEKEKKRLEETSDHIKQLQEELREVEARLKQLHKERDGLVEIQTLAKDAINRHESEKKQCQDDIDLCPLDDGQRRERFQDFETAYAAHLAGLSFQSCDRVRRAVENEQHGGKEKLINRKQKDIQRLGAKMTLFKNPGPEITDRFHDWRADTHKLSEDPRFVDEYIALLEKIEKEDLPSYRRKFEDYLSSTMINKIAGFKEFLDEGEEAIAENIETLNRSLQKISFKSVPSTYIQLKFPSMHDEELKEFKQMLREAIPDAARLHGEDSSHYKKQIFKQIRKLIDRLDSEENWRKKVIDVRNWRSYYAEEYYRENDAPMKVYKDMGKLSGGEKAQLTYTILGSAIAYQFGIKHKGMDSDSFRFIAVDETFSNQDDERATYLMDLCGQLHLQLLVVTPSDKIHIVEPYISYVHYVQRRANRESILFDMPIKQFLQHKEQVLGTSPDEAKN